MHRGIILDTTECRVSGLGGELCCLGLRGCGDELSLARLRAELEAATGTPEACMRLFCGTRELCDSSDLRHAASSCEHSHLDVLLVCQNVEQQRWLQQIDSLPSYQVADWLGEEAPPLARADHECILAAVAKTEAALGFAAAELRTDRNFVAAAVALQPYALRHAPLELRSDRDFVLAVVAKHADALRYASEKLKADLEIVFAAVSQNGNALYHAAPALRADRLVVRTAVLQNPYALHFAAEHLRCDPEFLELAAAGKKSRP